MDNRFHYLTFTVYEYQTFQFTIEWLIDKEIEFRIKTKVNEVGTSIYKFKINVRRIDKAKRQMLIWLITNEEAYDIRYVE